MSVEVPYLSLDPAIERSIREDRQRHWVNPCAFRDEDVTRREDNPHDAATLARPAFARDIEKILNLPAYNRYADKTQVFSLVENDEICRRGLHVQLVSRASRAIGELLGLNTQLIEAIALGHDLGHTPFGHAGERFLNECLEQRCGRSFRHNVQSVRVMDRLYRRNISLQTLDGALCHNGEFAQQVLKTGDCTTFDQLDAAMDACTRDASAIKRLRPSTLEGCVVRICDMVAYIGKDRQDAIAMGLIDSTDAFDSDYIGTSNAQILNNLTVDIVNHSYRSGHIALSEEGFRDLVRAKQQNYERIYDREGLAADARNVVQEMFAEMYERLLADIEHGDESSPVFCHHVRRLCRDSKSITPEGYLAQDPDTIVVDYISSMTDSYFLALHRHLFPNSSHRVQIRDYCHDLK